MLNVKYLLISRLSGPHLHSTNRGVWYANCTRRAGETPKSNASPALTHLASNGRKTPRSQAEGKLHEGPPSRPGVDPWTLLLHSRV